MSTKPAAQDPEHIAAQLLRLSPQYAATPLHDLPRLAARLEVAQVLAKDEGRRALASFKSLGGTYAGLRALARAAGTDIPGLLDPARPKSPLPALICASDGNHGLAVASAARYAGAPSRVYLHEGVAPARAARIEAQGGDIVWVKGTYDDSVDEALAAARAGDGILVADTTLDPDDPVVADVMAGYGVMALEIRRQVEASNIAKPTHLFVQAGCGGLAAAMTTGLKTWLAPPAAIVVVEPDKAACVTSGLAQGRVVRIPGDLETTAAMLACGEASAPALTVLRDAGAKAVTVTEAQLDEAVRLLREFGGPATTPSGAAGLAGMAAVAANAASARELALDATSRVLVIVSEAAQDGA